jgi:radical SAM protein
MLYLSFSTYMEEAIFWVWIMKRPSWPLDVKPLIVFWESTKACLLSCIHCRAEAIMKPLPGELSRDEAYKLIDYIRGFEAPYPLLVITGGDPLMRGDLWDVIRYALGHGIKVSLAPSVTPLLNSGTVKMISDSGISAVSISLDSPDPEVHDSIRGYRGVWDRTVKIIGELIDHGVRVQVNTVVMKPTVEGLPRMVQLLRKLNVSVWEVFYLVRVGRAQEKLDITPEEWEDVSHFLYEASKYGLTIRTVEGPMFRRVTIARRLAEAQGLDPSVFKLGPTYRRLVEELRNLMGSPEFEAGAQTIGTRDGRGIVFIAYNGDVYPSGFLPVKAGNIRVSSLKEVYLESRLFKELRAGNFKGRCGVCEFKDICGGSRARAYSMYGDPLAEDPACPYEPGSYSKLGLELRGST